MNVGCLYSCWYGAGLTAAAGSLQYTKEEEDCLSKGWLTFISGSGILSVWIFDVSSVGVSRRIILFAKCARFTSCMWLCLCAPTELKGTHTITVRPQSKPEKGKQEEGAGKKQHLLPEHVSLWRSEALSMSGGLKVCGRRVEGGSPQHSVGLGWGGKPCEVMGEQRSVSVPGNTCSACVSEQREEGRATLKRWWCHSLSNLGQSSGIKENSQSVNASWFQHLVDSFQNFYASCNIAGALLFKAPKSKSGLDKNSKVFISRPAAIHLWYSG